MPNAPAVPHPAGCGSVGRIPELSLGTFPLAHGTSGWSSARVHAAAGSSSAKTLLAVSLSRIATAWGAGLGGPRCPLPRQPLCLQQGFRFALCLRLIFLFASPAAIPLVPGCGCKDW